MRREMVGSGITSFDSVGNGMLRILASLICALALVMLSGHSAWAASVNTHPLVSTVSPPASATPEGPFTPVNVAVNQSSGNLYVVDATNEVIDVFDSSGKFLFVIDGADAVGGGFSFNNGPIAIDNSGGPNNGRIYVKNDDGTGLVGPNKKPIVPIDVLSPDGKFLFAMLDEGTNGPLADGLAVNSSGMLVASRAAGFGGGAWLQLWDLTPKVAEEYDAGQEEETKNSTIINVTGYGSLALDSTGNFYIANIASGDLLKHDPMGSFQWARREERTVSGVAVDRTTSTAYALEGSENSDFSVTRYDSSGAFTGRFGLSILAGSTKGIAVHESSGKIYVADPKGNKIAVFGQQVITTAPDSKATEVTAVTETTATLHGVVNPQGVPASWRFQYRRAKTRAWFSMPLQEAGSGTSDVPVEAPITGLAQNTSYEVRVQVANKTNGATSNSPNVITFTTPGEPQAILTIDSPSAITSSSVHASGSVDPNGSDTSWHFEYTTDNTFEENWIKVNEDQVVASGEPATSVSADIEGLEPNRHYFVRIVAVNDGGPRTSTEVEFTTDPVQPEAFAIGAGCLTAESACLGALIDAKNSSTTYYFEYGTDQTYGTSIPVGKDAPAGSGFGPIKRTQQISGLQPATTYHFRVVAENQTGTISDEGSFRTSPTVAQADVEWPRRGFELVSSPDKGNQLLNQISSGKISNNGNRVLWSPFSGAPGSTTGSFPIFLAERTDDGWVNKSVIPPAAEQPGEGSLAYALRAATPNLTSFIFHVNGGPVALPATSPLRFVRLDDDGTQKQLGPLFSNTSPFSNTVAATEDVSLVLSGNWSSTAESPGNGLLKLNENEAEPIDVPDCGVFTLNDSGPWLPPRSNKAAFFQSAGDGPCNLPMGVFRLDLDSGQAELISGAQSEVARFVRSTADGTAALYLKGGELYRWSTAGNDSICLTCGTGESEIIFPRVLASEDLEWIYFQSSKQLVAGQGFADAPCKRAVGSPCNTYVWHNGAIRFVAVIGAPSNSSPPFGTRATSQLSEGGSVLISLSAGSHTTADPTDAAFRQLYRYEAELGQFECVSCWDSPNLMTAGLPDRVLGLSGDGQTVAFPTNARLVHRDVNRSIDIYEWHQGVVRLVTDGVTELKDDLLFGEHRIWGLSDDGLNLIFSQRGRTIGPETDALENLYNARIGGGEVLEEPPAPCVEDSCQGPLEAPPPLRNPGSAGLQGRGNEQAKTPSRRRCGRAKVRKAGRCVRRRPAKRERAKRHRTGQKRGGAK